MRLKSGMLKMRSQRIFDEKFDKQSIFDKWFEDKGAKIIFSQTFFHIVKSVNEDDCNNEQKETSGTAATRQRNHDNEVENVHNSIPQDIQEEVFIHAIEGGRELFP